MKRSKAVLEALLGQQSAFARTPKTGAEGKKITAIKKSYRGSKTLLPVIELSFATYFMGALWFAIEKNIWGSVPFIFLFLAGFLYVGLSSLLEGRLKVSESAPAPVKVSEEQTRRAA